MPSEMFCAASASGLDEFNSKEEAVVLMLPTTAARVGTVDSFIVNGDSALDEAEMVDDKVTIQQSSMSLHSGH